MVLTPEDRGQLVAQLETDEGCVLHAYKDSVGVTTIGFGRNIDGDHGGGITQNEALYLMQNDLAKVEQGLSSYAWYTEQDSVRQAALCNMAYNLGLAGLLKFPKFLYCMAMKDYAGAANELTGSLWHQQVRARGDRVIKLISTGSWT